jgi:hypothetical protein
MVRQVHHERNQPNPSPFVLRFEGLVQDVLKGSSRIKWLIAVVLLVLTNNEKSPGSAGETAKV